MNRSPSQNARADPNRVKVSRSFVRMVNGVAVESSYGYTAVKEGGLWDAELIAWADRRETGLQRRRR